MLGGRFCPDIQTQADTFLTASAIFFYCRNAQESEL
ncbi:hypothetical protein HCH_00496 [Hahella chejuensis KCTC 2396]|uniref:Uncharacterized protein n=1 Tax=Hahella chejuensis (strain KCTC 2396) TaxID=349521 RepID=Q2SPM1_HAHCH|nr:hypothetical protein HCH_00496 [Hahella chejuensis KCTC 2396]